MLLLGWVVVAQLSPLLSALLQDIHSEQSCAQPRLLLGTSTPCRGVIAGLPFLRGLEQIPALLPVAWRSKVALPPLPNVPLM